MVLLGAAAVAVLTSSCSGLGQPSPTLTALKSTPGSTLTYPGAQELFRTEQDSSYRIGSNQTASITVYGCSLDAAEKVTQFFQQSFTSAGWTVDVNAFIPTPGQFERGLGWRKGSVTATLGFATDGEANTLAQMVNHDPACPTVYRTVSQ